MVVTRTGVGKLAIAKEPIAISQDITGVCPDPDKADTYFLYFLLLAELDNLKKLNQGTSINGIIRTDLERHIVSVPRDTAVQQKIARILQTIDQAIEKTEALINKYQKIKAGLMQDLFTRGIGPDGQLRPPREQAPELYQETLIGWIPKEWEVKEIGRVFSIQLGKMLSRVSKTGRDEFPYLGNKNVQWDRVDLRDLESMNFGHSEREKFKLLYGDILVCEGGEVGRTAMWRGDMDVCFYQKAIHRLRPVSGDVLPDFMLRFMFYAKTTGMFSNFTSQTSIAHLTREKLASMIMFLPGASEQELLVNQFDAVDKKLLDESTMLEKLQKQKAGLMHDLLTGKVPVQGDAKVEKVAEVN